MKYYILLLSTPICSDCRYIFTMINEYNELITTRSQTQSQVNSHEQALRLLAMTAFLRGGSFTTTVIFPHVI